MKSPTEIIKQWVTLFNKGNAEELGNLYDEYAVNHQVAKEPVSGRANIKKMFAQEFAKAEMTCLIENIFEDKEWGILEWKDPLGLRGCGFFHIKNEKIHFQRGYWDELSFLRQHNLPIPKK